MPPELCRSPSAVSFTRMRSFNILIGSFSPAAEAVIPPTIGSASVGHDLHLPTDAPPVAAAVVLHPHPAMGGDRHHPLVVAVADGLAGAGVAALRPDLTDPDVATSAGVLTDLASELRTEVGVERVFLVGYSWGSVVSVLASPGGLAARVLVAPPVAMLDLELAVDDVPTLLLVPAHDQYGGPDAVRSMIDGSTTASMEVVEGADHFLAGAIARIADRAVAWLATID
jgi:alpha/beta superfamily hydrolase